MGLGGLEGRDGLGRGPGRGRELYRRWRLNLNIGKQLIEEDLTIFIFVVDVYHNTGGEPKEAVKDKPSKNGVPFVPISTGLG